MSNGGGEASDLDSERSFVMEAEEGCLVLVTENRFSDRDIVCCEGYFVVDLGEGDRRECMCVCIFGFWPAAQGGGKENSRV